MYAYNIIWDTDGEKVNLPTEINIPKDIEKNEDKISDYISDVTGFCHLGFSLKEGCILTDSNDANLGD